MGSCVGVGLGRTTGSQTLGSLPRTGSVDTPHVSPTLGSLPWTGDGRHPGRLLVGTGVPTTVGRTGRGVKGLTGSWTVYFVVWLFKWQM